MAPTLVGQDRRGLDDEAVGVSDDVLPHDLASLR